MRETKVLNFPVKPNGNPPKSEGSAIEEPPHPPAASYLPDQIWNPHHRLADVIESIADGFTLYDSHDRLILWNQKFADILGDARDLLNPGMSFQTLVGNCAKVQLVNGLIKESERDTWIEESRQFQGKKRTYERRGPDGRCYLVSRRRTKQNYIAVVWTEITDRKQSEEALKASEVLYRELFEGSVQGIVIQTKTKIARANRAFARIFGLHAPEEIKSIKDLDQLFPVQERKRIRQLRRDIFAGKAVSQDHEFEGIRGDGTPIWVQATLMRLVWKGESAVQTTFSDITARKQFQEELIWKKLESVGTMARGIAMEFQKNLSEIMGAIRLAKMEAYASGMDTVAELLTEAEKNGASISDLTQQLLVLCREGAPVRERTSIGELIRDSLMIPGEGAKVVPLHKKKTKFKIHIAEDLSPVRVDRSQIKKILRTFIDHGFQSMHSGGTLKLIAENFAIHEKTRGIPLPPGKYVKIAIIDQGNGVPEELLDKIFDPYFSANQHKGGLALASAYSIVKHHGGAITVSSRPGKGTRLNVFLPVAKKENRLAPVW
ncbi:MAG: PAS domain S-box protein [SAR324 cluster bacterium]|nr:PAS domain S-box protein [SAR324 cluster bacterium]